MERRQFVKSALATAGIASGTTFGATPDAKALPHKGHEFYELRTYTLQTGPQLSLMQRYLETALIPALNQMHMAPVGVFRLDVGPQIPTYYVLIPSPSLEALIGVEARLNKDAAYMKGALEFRTAPAAAPAFVRAQSSLLSAFIQWPKIVPPKREKRIFQLRTYESPGQSAHERKVQMFHDAEIGIFLRNGLNPVFFADTFLGARMPSLTYMLTFADVTELTEKWSIFAADPVWKELSHKQGNTDADLVSHISNLYLSPLSCSQI